MSTSRFDILKLFPLGSAVQVRHDCLVHPGEIGTVRRVFTQSLSLHLPGPNVICAFLPEEIEPGPTQPDTHA